MMKMKLFALAAAFSLLLVSCGDPVDPVTPTVVDVSGTWVLSSVSTRSATIGDQTVDVYVEFASGSFTLYQRVGSGRYYKYTGTYSLSESVLSGKYSSGTAWGATYDVTVSGSTMTLCPKGGTEKDTYTKGSIPLSVISEALER